MTLATDHTHVPLAIIGMACRLPGADNLDQYWQLIIEGRSPIGEVPAARLDQQLYYDPEKGVRGKSYAKLAALLANREFDAERYPIDEKLRKSVDLMHLLMTGTAAEALRHAGHDPFNLKDRNTAVFIGNGGSSSKLRESTYRAHLHEAYRLLDNIDGFRDLPPAEQAAIRAECLAEINRLPSGVPDDLRYLGCNMMAGTVAKAFGLTGPWLALNSACASSLHAILMGARTLQQGHADMVIVGGASEIHAHTLVLFSQAQALSAKGSRPFDCDADGLVMSEGYVALVLKTLDKALADGDPIQAVVRGLGVATDGRGKSLWAPRKEGQIKAMHRAYRSGVDISQLQYIECHATATQLGDATELETLGEVLGPKLPPGKRVPVTSVKANIGHSLEAAGIAGVIKTVLCMQHKTIPPAISVNELNPKIKWETAPYYVPTSATPWEQAAPGQPRRAAVNAFGIGGLNMHVVLDEFTESARTLTRSKPQPAASPDDQAVAIIGIGCIYPGAQGLPKLWEQLVSGADPKVAPPAKRWDYEALPELSAPVTQAVGGFVTDFEYDWRKHKVPPKQVAEADPLQFMLLEAAEQALADAGYDRKPIERERCGVVVGTEFGGDFCDQLEMGLRIPEMQRTLSGLLRKRGMSEDRISAVNAGFADALLKKWPSLVDETGSFTSSTLASRVTKTLDLAGGAVAVDSGSTSAISALNICCDMLLSGDNDMMICAAGQRRMGPQAFESLNKSGLLAGDAGALNILDKDYQGVVPAEGVGVIIVKRLADARRDGDRIHTIIRGIGIAHHSSHAEALRLAAERAFAYSGVNPADIDLAEIDTDELLTAGGEELQSLAATHNVAGRHQPLAIGSPTAQFGHFGGASGIPALIKASLEIEHGQLGAAFGLRESHAALAGWTRSTAPGGTAANLSGRKLGAMACWSKGLATYIVLEHGAAQPIAAAAPYKNGSAAGHAVLGASQSVRPLTAAAHAQGNGSHKVAATVAAPTAATAPAQICRFGGNSLEQLLAQIDTATRNITLAWDAASTTRFQPQQSFRLAVVADGAEALARKLQLARPQLANPAARSVLEQQGVFYRQTSGAAPRVALVFPGQGSQYEGMLRELVRDVPAAAKALADFDAAMAGLSYPSFAELAWSSPSQLGTDLWVTQVAMLAADTIVLAALAERGLKADVMLGHSYGEFAALYAAGAFDLKTAIRLTKARCDGISAVANQDTGLLATDAQPELIAKLAAPISPTLYVANYNAPDQSVVGGRRTDLEALGRALQANAHQARLLAVPAAFHTPHMSGGSRVLEQLLAATEIAPLRVPVISTVSNAAVTEAGDIRRNLVQQLVTPVRYAQLIAQLAAQQPTVFVEVGPQQTLSKLNRRILDHAQAADASLVASDNPKRPGNEPLLFVQALVECLGVNLAASHSPIARPPVSPPASHPTSGKNLMDDQIPHFDATERRRAKMRGTTTAENGQTNGHAQASNGHGTPATMPQKAATPKAASKAAVAPSAPVARQVPAAPQRPVAPAVAAPLAAPVMARVAPAPAAAKPVAAPVPVAAAASVAAPAKATRAVPADLETFLVNFVVEQTGYPAEVVDLTADLEADLGIDSIKKAQLFGELNEYFDIGSSVATLSLDDFPTLGHVLTFLKSAQPAAAAPAAAPAAVAPVAKAPVATAPVAKVVVPQPAAVAAAPASAPAAPARNAEELEAFLIKFVVEQTGYPAEVVDLDADLEADLGIDSIKKAQLFGELNEYFDIGSAVATLSLDDFPTLRHVLNFLASTQAGSAAAPAAATPVVAASIVAAPVAVPAKAQPAPTAAPAVVSSPAAKQGADNAAELETFLINFVVEQTGYPAEVVDLDADLEADLGIDSIKKAQLFGELNEYFDIAAAVTSLSLDDFPTLRHVLNFLAQVGSSAPTGEATSLGAQHVLATTDPAPAVAAPNTFAPAPAFAPATQQGPELESFLINFVVEQTGYPAEVVDLDADLEADLGIDSIKKAQLFGELNEYFDIASAVTSLSLDDFPTLRHVLNFLSGVAAAPEAVALTATPAAAPTVAQVESNGHAELPPQDADAVVQLAGTPYDLGWQHGQRFRDEIRRILRHYAENADGFDELPGQANRNRPQELLSADELDELQGLADAVEVPLGNLLAHQLALASECGVEAGQLAVAAAHNRSRQLIHALRQPQPAQAVLCETFEPIAFLRTPASGIAHVAIAPLGTVSLCAGVNAAGVAVTAHPLASAHLHTTAAARAASAVTREILQSAVDLDSAIVVARSLRGLQAWCACVSHGPSDRVAYLEFNGQALTVRADEGTVVVGQLELDPQTQELVENVAIHGDVRSAAQAANGHATAAVLQPAELVENLTSSRTGSLRGAKLSCDALAVVIEPAAGAIWLAGAGFVSPTGVQRLDVTSLLTPLDATTLAAASARPQTAAELPPLPASRVARRLVFEMREAPLPAGLPTEPVWSGAAILLGNNPAADALRERLNQAGVAVYELPLTADVDTAVAQLEQICAAGPAPHLFITTGVDSLPIDPDHADVWARQRHETMALPFFVCQKWLQLAAQGGWLDVCTIVAPTTQGGDFGFAQGAEAAQGGALGGLLKGIYVEYAVMGDSRGLRVKAIDTSLDMPAAQLADLIFRELASGNVDYELAYAGNRRLVPYAVDRDVTSAIRMPVQPGSTWVVTGGARGITAACALELGRRYGLKLHLLGSTPLAAIDPAWRDLDEAGLQKLKASVMIAARQAGKPAPQAWERLTKDLEIDRSLQEFAAAGVHVTYHACDVSNRAALAATLDQVRELDGPIAGILHGAGVEKSCRFDKKQRAVVEATISVKVDGAAHLMALTRRDPIRHFLGFGSISGRFGGFGQTDYSLANEMLSKLVGAYRRRRPWVHATSYHWHPWDDVGMAARPETKSIIQKTGNLQMMPVGEGVAHFVREVAAGTPAPEVVITERIFWDRYAAQLGKLSANVTGTAGSASTAAESPAIHSSDTATAPPMVRNVRSDGSLTIVDVPLDPANDPFLVQHRLRNKPLLPVVVGLETLAEAAAAASGLVVTGFRNVDMIDGLIFHSDRPVTARVQVTLNGDGTADCQLSCDFCNRAGGLIQKDRPYLRATAELSAAPLDMTAELPAMPDPESWLPITYPDNAPVYHGTPFRGVTAAWCYDAADGWGRIVAWPLENLTGETRVQGWTVPSVVLDSAMYACGLHLWAQGGHAIALPRRITHLELGRAPHAGETCVVYFICRELAAECPRYDLVLVGEDGSVILRVEGYQKVVLGQGAAV